MEKKTFNNPVVEVVDLIPEEILTKSVEFDPDDTSPGLIEDEFGNLIG